MSKKILVTGGAGYIGSHVVYELCDAGHEVTLFDNMSSGLDENIDPRADFVKGDILSKDDLKKVFRKKFDVVFHFAALKAAGESMVKPEKYAENNISGTLNLLNMMVAHKVKNIVFSSSAAVYGDPQYIPIDENHPLNPINYYGYTKLAIEQNLHWYSQLKQIRFAALRYFNATGYDIKGRIKGKEINPANLSPIVMEVAAGTREKLSVFGNDYNTADGTCIRDYIHVNDLATAHVATMNYIVKNEENCIVNLGTGNGHSIIEVVAAARKVTGKEIPYEVAGRRDGDPAELVARADRAKEIINWMAKHSDLETIFKSMRIIYLVSNIR